jgi:hypothetical protein
MSWEYGALATEVYDLDKPIGRSFGDVEYYTCLLAKISGPILEPHPAPRGRARGRRPRQLGGDARDLPPALP